jgi:hypothetical protein
LASVPIGGSAPKHPVQGGVADRCGVRVLLR